MAGPRRIERRDRGNAMRDSMVVHDRRIERLGQREAAERIAGAIDGRRPADDVVAVDKQDEDEVDPVPVHPFRCRLTRRARPCFDAELMNLDVPRSSRCHPRAKQAIAEAQDRRHARSRADVLGNRREPALDPAEERVVVAMLVMRLMRLPLEPAIRVDRIHREPAAATPLSFSEVLVERQVVPARRKRGPAGQRTDGLERAAHRATANERKTRLRQVLFHHTTLRSFTGSRADQWSIGLNHAKTHQ